ncbi:MAG: hypothetical protein HYT72_03380 [Candidatus Aenigmarchaeota archaeon]|nr:hypothetical protein [Candidatus Aenigmarchaeota archaeon]
MIPNIGKEEFIKILTTNFPDQFEMVNDEFLGQIIKTDVRTAFLFMDCTGDFVMLDEEKKLTPASTEKTGFYVRDFRYTEKYLEKDYLLRNYEVLVPSILTPLMGSTALQLSESYPDLFHGTKFIVPLFVYNDERKTRKELSEVIRKIKDSGKEIQNFIFSPISVSAKGGSMEPFCEFVACNWFKNLGYLVENQIQWSTKGVPDAAAYKHVELINKLVERKFISSGGFLRELQLLKIFGKVKDTKKVDGNNETIVFEAKTSARYTQIDKYLGTRLFDLGFDIVPHRDFTDGNKGLISFEPDGKLTIKGFEQTRHCYNEELRSQLLGWIEISVKHQLACNLTVPELLEITKSNSHSITKLVRDITNLELDKILDFLEQRI